MINEQKDLRRPPHRRDRAVASGRIKSRSAQGKTIERPAGRTGRGLGYRLVYQGVVLAAVSIIVRLIGMMYRIPLISIIGYEGNGYYTSAFSVYTLLLLFSSYSMPIALSKIVSEDLTAHRYRNISRVMKAALLYATVMGATFFLILWFGAEPMAMLLRKPFSKFVLRALAPSLWLMAYLSVMRGYFQGSGDMIPTAVSQILEQIVNAIVSLLVAKLFYHKGMIANRLYETTDYGFAFGAKGAAVGTGAGILVAFLFFVMLYRMGAWRRNRQLRRDETEPDDYRSIFARLLKTLLPFLFTVVIYNSASVIDDFLYGNVMNVLGTAEKLVAEWGVYGEYHMLFNIPVAMASAMSLAVVPGLTRAVNRYDRQEMENGIHYALRATMLVAIPAGVGLLALARPIVMLLFPGEQMELLIRLIRIGSAATICYSFAVVTTGILLGLGFLVKPLVHSVIALLFHTIVLTALLFTGSGIYGVVLANILFAVLMSVMNMFSIHKHTQFRQDIARTYVVPAVAAGVMGIVVFALSEGMQRCLPTAVTKIWPAEAICTIPMIFFGAWIYVVFLNLLKDFTAEDAEQLPFFNKFIWRRYRR